jgi:hypothetical protein
MERQIHFIAAQRMAHGGKAIHVSTYDNGLVGSIGLNPSLLCPIGRHIAHRVISLKMFLSEI